MGLKVKLLTFKWEMSQEKTATPATAADNSQHGMAEECSSVPFSLRQWRNHSTPGTVYGLVYGVPNANACREKGES